jgi:hypothetical protein
MKTLFAIGRLVRLPMLFCFLADAAVIVLLRAGEDIPYDDLKAVWLAAAGLYLFATAGNDAVDAHRDRRTPPPGRTNPIATGDLPVIAGVVLAIVGAAVAAAAAVTSPIVHAPTVLVAMAMIAVYNAGARRFPPIGLVLLGLIRAANAAQTLTPDVATQWWAIPAVIAAHTIFVSAFAYAWERRRPPLYGNNWFHLLVLVAAAIAGLTVAAQRWSVRFWPAGTALTQVWLVWGLFALVFVAIFTRTGPAQRGPLLRMVGLNWLILVDYAFLLAAGLRRPGWVYLILAAAAAVSIRLMALAPRRPTGST